MQFKRSVMSRADYKLLNNYVRILTEGSNDFDMSVRPRWEDDNSPAHTVRVFGEVQRYNLQEEFPIASVRKLFWQSCIDEILWIWQKKSNNVKDLNARIWDQWANKGEHADQEIGSIGKAYGYQLGKKIIKTPNGNIDQVDNVLNEIKNNPANRRILTNVFNHEELHEMNLAPCVYGTKWIVNNGKLNLVVDQRSHDTLSAGAWNVVQYAALLAMFAQVSNLQPGEMVHVVADSHCYDRHIPREFQVILKRCSLIQQKAYSYYLHNILEGENETAVKHFMEVLDLLKEYEFDIDFDKEFEKANNVAHDNNTDWFEYLNYVRKTPEMDVAKSLIQKMIAYPEVDRILGFKTPNLKLDPNVTNFYDFVSPRTYTGTDITVENGELVRDGKYANNPNSSFVMENYDPQTEGFEFDTPVPVAK